MVLIKDELNVKSVQMFIKRRGIMTVQRGAPSSHHMVYKLESVVVNLSRMQQMINCIRRDINLLPGVGWPGHAMPTAARSGWARSGPSGRESSSSTACIGGAPVEVGSPLNPGVWSCLPARRSTG